MIELPCDFIGGRFVLRVPVSPGRIIRLLVDTGGGYHLDPSSATGLARVPTGLVEHPEGVRLHLDPPIVGHDIATLIARQTDEPGLDGALPAQWFADRVWRFDFAGGVLFLHEPDDPEPLGAVPLGFPSSGSHRTSAFPRVRVGIDAEPVDVLLDTGATAQLTDGARQQLGWAARHGAISFATESLIGRWRAQHPDWPVIAYPSTLGVNVNCMIRVPGVVFGVLDLGPVWFESRPDRNFVESMSQWMDRTVVGALGANAFAGRRLTLNYPRATAAVA